MRRTSLRARFLFITGVLSVISFTTGCEEKEVFPDMGTKVAGPADVALAPDNNHFYVLNSDFDREYNKGSILIIDKDGAKIRAVETPRMGIGLTVAGNRMIALFDAGGPDEQRALEIFDLTDPLEPKSKKRFPLECSPLHVAARENYNHFVVTCAGGKFFVGTFGADLADSTLKLVRNYQANRRAIYIDTKRELVFAFTTDLQDQDKHDSVGLDQKTYADDNSFTEVPNEMPDAFESTRRARNDFGQQYVYQFVVYDLKAEREAGFPYRELQDPQDATAASELRWLYFTLKNFDGTPDSDVGIKDLTRRHYRTNIWEAKPDPLDDNSFYFSHRGPKESVNANNIVKVTIEGDPHSIAATSGSCPASYRLMKDRCIPLTSDTYNFERVYGFNGEVDHLHYPGDFLIGEIAGEPFVVVNHFRDLFYWPNAGDHRFSIAVKSLDNSFWSTEIQSTSHKNSFFQLAMTPGGRLITTSFYGNTVLLLDVMPGTDITVKAQIN